MGADAAQIDLRTLFEPIAQEKSIGLAVSGGSDSLGLMLLVHSWLQAEGRGTDIVVYCVDHRLREESAGECAEVARLAADLGFKSRTLIWRGEKPDTGVQAAARVARYRLIGREMQKDDVHILLTGHHMQDQSETVLMRLAHSSGISGLAGMRQFSEVEGVTLFRPLLKMRREYLADIVSKAGYVPADDPSNGNEKYERVRWRKLLPKLEAQGLTGDILERFALRMGRAEKALGEIAENIFTKNVKFDQFGVCSLPLNLLKTQPDEIALRIVDHLIVVATGRDGAELSQLEKLLSALLDEGFPGGVICGCKLEIWRGNLVAFRESGKILPEMVRLDAGEKLLWDQRFNLENKSDEVVEIQSAKSVDRAEIEEFLGESSPVKMTAIHAVPLVRGDEGEPVLLGGISKCPGVTCRYNWSKSA